MYLRVKATVLAAFAGVLAASFVRAAPVNYDEAKVAPLRLPDPLRLENGHPVTNATAWFQHRRPELLDLFQRHVYGRPLPRPPQQSFRTQGRDMNAVGGRAVREDVRLEIGFPGEAALDFTILRPSRSSGPVPVFLGLHLFDTRAAQPRPAVPRRISSPSATPAPAGGPADVGTEVLHRILDRGYAVASLDLDALSPDSATNFWKGAARLSGWSQAPTNDSARTGALGIWAWGLSRALDYFETTAELDARRVAVIGHSRMGKAALWAGALDTRFALVIANESGCGGAALNRRDYGESIEIITRAFPHWFAPRFREYAGHEDRLPVDQHQLIALLAPRPVYVGSAEEDRWADPRGEFLALLHAEPVYRLLGAGGLGVPDWPEPDRRVGDTLGYHLRRGQHDLTDFDWDAYLNFADRHFRP